MELSFFLARVIGLFLVIIGFLCLGRRKFLEKPVIVFFENDALTIISGVFVLIIGLLIIVGHNVWEWNWTLIITILGYFILLKAFALLFFPGLVVKKLSLKLFRDSSPIFLGIICLIVGLILVYEGFVVS
ncbi:MAG: hypothetical protein WAM28_06265 [Chlamydiales bacterium]